jgi:hypothetical protein
MMKTEQQSTSRSVEGLTSCLGLMPSVTHLLTTHVPPANPMPDPISQLRGLKRLYDDGTHDRNPMFVDRAIFPTTFFLLGTTLLSNMTKPSEPV